jgi:hypothetical protein
VPGRYQWGALATCRCRSVLKSTHRLLETASILHMHHSSLDVWMCIELLEQTWTAGDSRPSLCAGLMMCDLSGAHVVRFLLSEALRPLLSELYFWTHGSESSPGMCPSLLRERPYRRLFDCGSPADAPKPWLVPLSSLRLNLPSFLLPMHDVILTTGIQMRFLASLPQCSFTISMLRYPSARCSV